MEDIYVKAEAVQWAERTFGGQSILIPQFLSERHNWWATWESSRFSSMQANLRPGDILFDIGSEQGYMSCVYARFVGGGEHLCLFEPAVEVWPNAKTTWEANGLATPLATWCGFVSSETRTAEYHDFHIGYRDGWPECAYTGLLLDATKFRYDSPTEQASSTDSITIDDFCRERGIVPMAITMDIEGFEIRALQGAVETIKACSPLIWISEHTGSNNMLRRFEGGDPVEDARRLMQELGYKREELGTDHETHVLWYP